jgi:hypothetical protein
MAIREEQATRNRFADRYGEDRTEAVERIERADVRLHVPGHRPTGMRATAHLAAASRNSSSDPAGPATLLN